MICSSYQYGSVTLTLNIDSNRLLELIERDTYPYFRKVSILESNNPNLIVTIKQGLEEVCLEKIDGIPVLLHPRDQPLYGKKQVVANKEIVYNPNYPAKYEMSNNTATVTYYGDVFNGFIGFRLLISPLIYRLSDTIDSLTFHASSIEKNGNGYMFVGPKGSGKTSSVISLALDSKFSFMSNDYSMVRFSNAKGIMLFGTPEAIRLGEGTYDALKEQLDQFTMNDKVNSKYILHLRNLHNKLKLCREAVLKGIFVVNLKPDCREEVLRVPVDESYQFINENLMEKMKYQQPQVWKYKKEVSMDEIAHRIRILCNNINIYKLNIAHSTVRGMGISKLLESEGIL